MSECSDRDEDKGTKKDFKEKRSEGWRITWR